MVYEHGHMYKGVRVNSFGIPLFLLGGDIDKIVSIIRHLFLHLKNLLLKI